MIRQKNCVVVVGATGAIGEPLSKRFLQQNFGVLGVARRSTPSILQLKSESNFSFCEADAGSETAMRAFFTQFNDDVPLYSVVYAAGLTPDMNVPLAQYSVRDWQKTIDTYLSGFLWCFQGAMRCLVPRGHIVVLSSAVTRFSENSLPPFFIGHYSAAKAALNELCKWARREAHQSGFLLSRISPSAVDVPYHRDAPPSRRPPATVPLSFVLDSIVTAVSEGKETDEEIIATPTGLQIVEGLQNH